ncbi:extracellular solute-binding protein [Paratractidigestivibacter sp.]|uniref:extracellular solute-binding protein n=1 Tax=Paratractidigestivibacter sp. TaxID=2847316 RepID=UPI002ABD55E0|nr:extracellular solute-binding protein [Paratractidigestivibacter sp.]
MVANVSRRGFLGAAATTGLGLLSGCGASSQQAASSAKTAKLDPSNPTNIGVWHYYNGSQQAAFDDLVNEFNTNAGKEKGIYVEAQSLGSVSDLEAAISDSLAGVVGSSDLPTIFFSYSDTAYTVQQAGKLAEVGQYFTADELSAYVEGYLKEGYLLDDDKLYLLPVAKSTETFMINVTDWEPFAAATGATFEDLATTEGVTKVAQSYHEWSGGRAFYGRDSMSNYFIIGMRQMGAELFDAADGKVTLNLDRDKVRRLWDNYYVPYVNGWFKAAGKFRSDDVKTGEILAYTGSTASATYFPDQVTPDSDTATTIGYKVLAAPIMEGGERVCVQQGAGMCVSASDDEHEYAAVEFLKWFSEPENNLRFVCQSSYLPVLMEANTVEALDAAIKNNGLKVSDKTYDTLSLVMSSIEQETFYAAGCFENGSAARKVLDYNLSDKAAADRAAIEQAIAGGASAADAVAPYVTDDAFSSWFTVFKTALESAIAGSK